ncbi:anion permease [Symbiobacterium thermophilum]|uniref:2-oxoglutarate/malate translocator n=1 Tax=Symbiobacterium thermophilum (strain DSM 24528 / JCM 14929 / IAM 14863 / T) TaxID=292459 RepID=Q67L25_SYMTH|nr:anion permease [Symbiobacterium thermophilum]BAD41621.1 2-oxoglutarate/malate translocator [Symbiobacterium thermophilum IAM 14863]
MRNDDRSKLIRGLICVAVGLIIWFLPAPGDLEPVAMHLLGIFVATILGLILQPLPQGAVVITAVAVTAITGTLSIGDALNGFKDSTVWLIVTAFLFARGLIKTGLGRRISFMLVKRFGKSTLGLGYALALSDTVLAPATPSNTARAGGILFPIVRALCSSMGSEPGPTAKRVGQYLMYNSFQICCITSALFFTGVAPNSLIATLAKENFGYEITWLGWLWAALLPGVICIAILPRIYYKIFNPELKYSPEAPALAEKELAKMGPMSTAEKGMLAVFLLTLVLWATSQWTNLNATAIALLGVAILLVIGVLDWQDVLAEKGGWDALIWFGGLVGLATGLSKVGIIGWLASILETSLGGISSWFLAFILVVIAYTYSHYFIASMTAHATAFFVPLALVAISAGAPLEITVLVLGFFNSLNAVMTHYGTGPAPIYFGAGYIDQGTWWKWGFVTSLINLVVWLGAGSLWWKVIGLW